MEAFTRWVIRNSVSVVVFSAILSLVAGFFTLRLYGNLRTDLEELLPSNARSVQDLKQISQRLPSSTNLAILAFSDHADASWFRALNIESTGKFISLSSGDPCLSRSRIWLEFEIM